MKPWLFKHPPRRIFHAFLVLPALATLWAASYPGFAYLVAVPVFWVLVLAALLWLIRLVLWARAWRRGERAHKGWWFVVAPAGGLLVLALVLAQLPLKLRWDASKAEFDEAVATLRRNRDAFDKWDDDRRIGLYAIVRVNAIKQGYIFYEKTGDLFDDAGFAYLPHGPSPVMATGSFENPQWNALGDHWYSWTASW